LKKNLFEKIKKMVNTSTTLIAFNRSLIKIVDSGNFSEKAEFIKHSQDSTQEATTFFVQCYCRLNQLF